MICRSNSSGQWTQRREEVLVRWCVWWTARGKWRGLPDPGSRLLRKVLLAPGTGYLRPELPSTAMVVLDWQISVAEYKAVFCHLLEHQVEFQYPILRHSSST